MLEDQRTLVAALLARVYVLIVLVLHLLLLHLPLVLLHLLRSTGIITHVVQVHLLLDVHVVLGGGTLLLRLDHHLVATYWLIRVHSVRVPVLRMLPVHGLAVIVHEEVALVVLRVLLVAARVGVLAGAVAQWCDDDVLDVVVD